MSSHYHDSSAGTQNQGNKLGDRPCVRQSKLFRQYESGNSMKAILGSGQQWQVSKLEGAYSGQSAYDFNNSTQAQTRKAIDVRVDRYDETARDGGANESRRPLNLRKDTYDNYSAPQPTQARGKYAGGDYSGYRDEYYSDRDQQSYSKQEVSSKTVAPLRGSSYREDTVVGPSKHDYYRKDSVDRDADREVGRARGHLEGLSERSSTRLFAPPGGVSSFSLIHDEGPDVRASYSDGRIVGQVEVGLSKPNQRPARKEEQHFGEYGRHAPPPTSRSLGKFVGYATDYGNGYNAGTPIPGLESSKAKSTRPW